MFAAVSEDFDEEFGGSVDDGGMVVEIGIGIYESVESDDLFHVVEGADGFLDDGESVEDDDACALHGVFDGAGGGDFAEDLRIAIDGESAGEVEHVSAANAVHVGGNGCGDFREGEAEGFDSGEGVVLHGRDVASGGAGWSRTKSLKKMNCGRRR